MARSNKKAGPSKLLPSSRKANAAGYKKRRSAKGKAKTFSGGLSDVYEYEQQKIRRSKISLKLDRYEAAEYGVNENGEDESRDHESRDAMLEWMKRPRLMGENDGDVFDPEDDEEIDSDEAFEESDEERFAGFSFASDAKKRHAKEGAHNARPTTRPKSVRFQDVDLNEDDDDDGGIEAQGPVKSNLGSSLDSDEEDDKSEEEEGEVDEFIDVLDVLDGRGDPDITSDNEGSVQHEADGHEATVIRQEHENDVDEDEGEESEEESSVISEEDAENQDPEALDKLENFLTDLGASQKRKAEDASREDNQPPRKRRFMQERTTSGVEGEFNAAVDQSKLQLDDLLTPLASQSSVLLSLKNAAKPLASSSKAALDAPLPTRTQERLDREAAYEQTKEEVDKWKATMKRIKEAEHLSFPLQAPPASRPSNLELTAKFKPTTELETSVDRLLKSAKMREEDLEKTEDLMMNDLSVDEVAARRAELRKMRDLVFRADMKAKRIAKIKSKTFRKIKKKERQKLMSELDAGEDEDEDKARLKREVERARERATLKHKNTGKWAKEMKGRHDLDVGQRQEITDMLERGEVLRRKIRGEGESSEDDSEDESDLEGLKARAFDELRALRHDDLDEADISDKHKSIFNMKFMRDAASREQRKVNEEADDFIREMGGHPSVDEDESNNADEPTSGVIVQRIGGRVQYKPGASSQSGRISLRPTGSLASDASSVTLKSTDFVAEGPIAGESLSVDDCSSYTTAAQTRNPWLAAQDTIVKGPRRQNEVVVSKGSSSIQKSKYKLRKEASKREDAKEKAQDDAVVEISLNDVLTLGVSEASKKQPRQTQPPTEDDDSDANSEVEEQEKSAERKTGKSKGGKAFEQCDLVALAFAGDNVVQEFEAAKRQEMEEDAPHEIDTTLPGWGSWGGKGAKKKAPMPRLIKKVAGIDPKSRADYKKSHIIISEKRDKKAAKYLLKDLPHPYTGKAQYERRMDTPLGTEWNTRLGFQRGTLPKVTKKMGTIIRPLEKVA